MKRIFTKFHFLYKSSLALFALGLGSFWWYIPHVVDLAFSNIKCIMRDVVHGGMILYSHAKGESVFSSLICGVFRLGSKTITMLYNFHFLLSFVLLFLTEIRINRITLHLHCAIYSYIVVSKVNNKNNKRYV